MYFLMGLVYLKNFKELQNQRQENLLTNDKPIH